MQRLGGRLREVVPYESRTARAKFLSRPRMEWKIYSKKKPSCWAICLFRQQGVSHWNFVFLFCRFDRRVCTVISMILAGVFCLIFSVASVAFLKAGIDYVVVQGGWGGGDFTFSGKPLIFLTRWGIFYGWWRCWRPVTSPTMVAILDFTKN